MGNNTDVDIRYTYVKCDKCKETYLCSPHLDFYTTPLWSGQGRVCEYCFQELAHVWYEVKGFSDV